jgi:predicted nucleic acid-binding protein
MTKPRVYVETSVFSYLTARDSSSLMGAARQLATRLWWDERSRFEVLVSEVVVRECRAGDEHAVVRRMAALDGLPLLALSDSALDVANTLLHEGIMPAKASEDALHIAIASVHEIDFLLSWNFKHIANPVIQARIAKRLSQMGLRLPFICPPEELLGDNHD